MNVNKKIKAASPYFDEKSIQNILYEIKHTLIGGILTQGPHVTDFENKYSSYIKCKHAIAVNSGTAALEIPLRYYNLKGKEVIVPTNTFVATPNTVIFAGGKPVFADMREDTLCIDPEDIKKKITSNTVGIVVVHIAGLVCPQMKEIKELCEDHNLFLLEDAAHAHGASLDNIKAGSFGDGGCFSFYPTKVMTTGEGGMITTNNSKLANVARSLRTHGLDSNGYMIRLGHNWRLSEISAILGKYQLEKVEEFINKRNAIADAYMRGLKKIDEISLFKFGDNMRHSYYKYPILVHDVINKDKLVKKLLNNYGIETGHVYYPPCHLHPFYKENMGTKEGDLPVSENILKNVVCLPISYDLNKNNVDYIIESLISTIEELSE